MKPIVFVLTIMLAGLTPAPSAAQQTPASSDKPAHKVFVLNGCLATQSGAADAFKLTGAVPVGQAPPERQAASAEPQVYVLLPTQGLAEQGVARAEMQTHVGKKVEVTVRPVEVAPGPSKSSSSTPAAEKVEEPTPPRYTVTEIKPVAGSCPA